MTDLAPLRDLAQEWERSHVRVLAAIAGPTLTAALDDLERSR